MNRNHAPAALLLLCSMLLPSLAAGTGPAAADPSKLEINGVRLHVDSRGSGPALLLLHGGLGSSADFEQVIPMWSDRFRVIAYDRRGHGRSEDNAEPYRYASMADEADAVLGALGVDSAVVVGWSDGGVVGYHLAARYPKRVRKLVAVGANIRVAGIRPADVEWTRRRMTESGMDEDLPEIGRRFREVNPQPGRYAAFLRKTRDLWLEDPYIPAEDFRRIACPVLLAAGDRDAILPEHMLEMRALLPNARLCIFPNTSHFIFEERADWIRAVVDDFIGD